MQLRELLKGVTVLASNVDMTTRIRSVAYDSRKVEPDSLFVAISGFAADGNRFIPMALEKGAAAIVTAVRPETDVPYILVESDRLALAQIGCNFYGDPAKSMKLIGITGTNGKTSATLLLKHVLERTQGAKVGLIGTMANMVGDTVIPTERTTPESFELQALFAQMRDAGCTHVVMEVSSHAIVLERIGGLRFDAAAFTNLTEDHLDFHKTMDAYCEAKAELFHRCDQGVVNVDDRYGDRMLQAADCPILTTAIEKRGDLRGENIRLNADGVMFDAVMGDRTVAVKLGIPGKFTVYNALTVLGLAVTLGIPMEAAAAALEDAPGVRGRVEVVPTPGKPYTILVDYAHTPDGLENILRAVRGFCKGRLIAVFGCGGDRGPMKRPIMGRIGTELSDLAILTSDNPRSEDPEGIIADILPGAQTSGGKFEVEPNRRKAIRRAMDLAGKDDVIVLAGKGHETYQEICGVKYHLDEREEVAAYLMEARR